MIPLFVQSFQTYITSSKVRVATYGSYLRPCFNLFVSFHDGFSEKGRADVREPWWASLFIDNITLDLGEGSHILQASLESRRLECYMSGRPKRLNRLLSAGPKKAMGEAETNHLHFGVLPAPSKMVKLWCCIFNALRARWPLGPSFDASTWWTNGPW